VDWPTCLHVAGSRIVLQCLATTTKSVILYWTDTYLWWTG